MFEEPQAKRVRREDLLDHGGASDGEEDAQMTAQLEAKLAQSLGFDFTQPPPLPPSAAKQPSARSESAARAENSDSEDEIMGDAVEEKPAEEEYDFCLFGGSNAGATKVNIHDDSEPEGEGGFEGPRPTYLTLARPSVQQRERYGVAAMTGDQVLARSSWRNWSSELPWKVTHITITRKGVTVVPEGEESEEKRRRPGKKRRIQMRTKVRQEEEQKKSKAKLREEKEEHLKEKKKRANRAKKLRRRAQAREKKAADGGDPGDDGDVSSGSE
ncbi:putative nucleolar protein-like protein [Emericellopsis cladophorae]|uniref:Nucleolar protein-like protein n=1 Tax=Emericellopsis cladophorae TaxID=2686198 RepID=A0A9P9Y3G3_9HYPO|nr:putative nucleolar protein-like protein [Emericellopsis cladophorae]KAI6782923.1 putative nucleolar protein-like protein [Emericellopsis cladophorae]